MATESMQGLEMDLPFTDNNHNNNNNDDTNFCTTILIKFNPTSPTNDLHQHICALIGTMSHELTERNATSHLAYFGAIVSALDRLSPDPTSPPLTLDALLVLLSLVLVRISPSILRSKREMLLELVSRVLRGGRVSEHGVVAGLKCVSLLLVVKDFGAWDDVCHSYGVLLSFVTNHDSKVRRQAYVCIRDVLQSFQGSPLLSPASGEIVHMLEKPLLLAGSSKGVPAEKGAQEIVHVLEALKIVYLIFP